MSEQSKRERIACWLLGFGGSLWISVGRLRDGTGLFEGSTRSAIVIPLGVVFFTVLLVLEATRWRDR